MPRIAAATMSRGPQLEAEGLQKVARYAKRIVGVTGRGQRPSAAI